MPYPTTDPLQEHELTELALLWGRLSVADIEVTFPTGADLADDFAHLIGAMGRLIDEVGRLRGVLAAGAMEAPPASTEGTR